MVLFGILTAFVPRLDRPDFFSLFQGTRIGRRLLAGGIAVVLIMGPAMPARAQVVTTDPNAWIQRAMEYVKNTWRHLDTKSDGAVKFIRQAAMSYQDYQQARALYQRVGSGNVAISLVESLPVIDVYSTDGVTNEKLTIRPVFRERDRLQAPRVNVRFEMPDWRSMLRNLDFDVSTVRTPVPDAKKTPQQIRSDAVSDGWLSWQIAQRDAPVDQVYWNVPNPNKAADPYAGLREEVREHYRKQGEALQLASENARELYGGESPQYQHALQTLADHHEALRKGEADKLGEALQQALEAVDAQAEIVIQKYASARNELGMTLKREDAKDNNLLQVNGLYSQTPDKFKPFSLFDFIEGKIPPAPQGGQAGVAIGSQVQAEQVATTANQQFKYELTNDMRQAQLEMQALAEKKAKSVGEMRSAMKAAWVKARMNVIDSEMRKYAKAAEIVLAAATMPEGSTLVVPDNLVPLIPGSIPSSSPRAGNALIDNLESQGKKHATLAEKILANEVKKQAKGFSWDLVRPVLAGIDAAGKKLFNKSFDLTKWAQAT